MILSISGNFSLRRKLPPQFLKAMKLTAFLLTVAFLQVHAKSFSQVSLSLKDAPVEKVFREIEHQTGYGFLYTKEMLADLPKVTIDVKNAPIKQVLNECFKGQSLEYSIDNNTVVIKRKIAVPDTQVTAFLSSPPIEIHGRVLNQSGEPLQNVSVIVAGTKVGTTTDNDGRFTLTAPDNNNIVLEISSVGYQKKTVKVGKQTEINVILEEEVAGLNEVVVIGYGTTVKRKDFTGAVSSVKMENSPLALMPNLNPLEALKGNVSGLNIGAVNTAGGQFLMVAEGVQVRFSRPEATSTSLGMLCFKVSSKSVVLRALNSLITPLSIVCKE